MGNTKSACTASSTMLPERPRIAIVGSGAIGSYFGACLAQQGADVHFLMRSDLDSVRKAGLRVNCKHMQGFHLPKVNAYGSTEDIGPCDLVFVALKTTQNAALTELIPPLLKDGTVLVTLQNGMGNTEFLAEHFGKGRAMGGLVYMGINRTEPGVIENYNPEGGYVTIGEAEGPATERVEGLCRLLQCAGINAKPTDDLQMTLWRKLVWNVPFNGLAIVGGSITTDKILESPELSQLAQALMRDVQAGAKANGRDLPDSFLEKQFAYTRDLRAYKPSSLIDFVAKRAVEVEAIWGEPLRRGQAAGAKMPYLESVYWLLKALAAQNQA